MSCSESIIRIPLREEENDSKSEEKQNNYSWKIFQRENKRNSLEREKKNRIEHGGAHL